MLRKPKPGRYPKFQGRLQLALSLRQDLSNLRAAAKVAKATPQKFQAWWDGKVDPRKIQAGAFEDLANGLGVSSHWLLHDNDRGPMTKGRRLMPEEEACLTIFRALEKQRGWRDNWMRSGQDIVRLLDSKPSVADPFPVESMGKTKR